MIDTLELDLVRSRLAGLERPPGPADIAAAMRAEGMIVTDDVLMQTIESLRRNSVGAGKLEPLLRQPDVTDVLVNGPDQVYVDRGFGLELTGVRFSSDADVRRLAQRLASMVGRRLDEATRQACTARRRRLRHRSMGRQGSNQFAVDELQHSQVGQFSAEA